MSGGCARLGQAVIGMHQPAKATDLALRPAQLVLRDCIAHFGFCKSIESVQEPLAGGLELQRDQFPRPALRAGFERSSKSLLLLLFLQDILGALREARDTMGLADHGGSECSDAAIARGSFDLHPPMCALARMNSRWTLVRSYKRGIKTVVGGPPRAL